MQANQIPAKFPVPWGNAAGNGYIRNIPTASQQGITAGAASLTDGFPPICFTAVGSGGIPPSGQDFNGILAQITAWNRWQAAGGTVSYDGTFSAAVSGYPVGAILQSTTAGLLWLNTADGNTTNPDGTNPTGWIAILTSSSASAQTGAQAAKSGFNTQAYQSTQRVSMATAGTNVLATAVSGLSFNKQSATSLIRVQGTFIVRTPHAPGNGYGPSYFNLTVGSASVQQATNNGYPAVINLTPVLAQLGTKASPLAKGNLAISLQFGRADASAWDAIFLPNSSDESGYPASTLFQLFVDEVEPT